MWAIDARQLSYAGTGLASVTAEVLRVLAESGQAREFAVLADARVNPRDYLLDEEKFVWIRVPLKEKGPDYINRVRWSRAVLRELKNRGLERKIFIPYAYNYGDLSRNVVWIPDLINRIVPLAHFASIPFWAVRRKFYLRRMVVWFEEKRVNRARKFLCYSQFVRDHACEVFGLAPEKFKIVPLGVGQTLLKWKNAEPGLPAVELPERFALYVGGIGLRKNVPMLLKACGEVIKIDPTFRCVFVGLTAAVVEKDKTLSAIFADENVRVAAIFCPKVSEEELAALYRKCQFSLYPSRSEGFGLPIVEAAAFGKLCLCADNSSMKEIQLQPAYRVETDDVKAWASTIQAFWSEPAKIAAAAPDVAELAEKYEWNRSGRIVLEFLRSLDVVKST